MVAVPEVEAIAQEGAEVKKLIRWVPLVTFVLSIGGALYNQGLRIEHRLTVLETKLDEHLRLGASNLPKVIETKAKAARLASREALEETSDKCAQATDRALNSERRFYHEGW